MTKRKFPDLIFESTAHLLAELDKTAAEARAALVGMTDEELQKNWKLSFGEKVIVAFRTQARNVLLLTDLGTTRYCVRDFRNW